MAAASNPTSAVRLESREVLRGPQGTLYGASSMSGTIRFIPNSPDLNTLGGYVTMEGSQTQHASGNYNINGEVNLPIIDGVLALRMVGWKLYDSGYINQYRVGEGVTGITNIGTSKAPNFQTEPVAALGFVKGVNDDDVGGGRAIVRFHPNDNLTIDANYTTQTETSGGSSRYTPAGVAVAGGPSRDPDATCAIPTSLSPWSDTRDFRPHGGIQDWLGVTQKQPNNRTVLHSSTPSRCRPISVPAETLEAHSQGQFQRTAFCERSEFCQLRRRLVNTRPGSGRASHHHWRQWFGDRSFSTSTAQDALISGVGNTFFGRTDQRDTQYAASARPPGKYRRVDCVAGVRHLLRP